MKFFHIADLHIGRKLYNRDLYEDQKDILNKIVECAKSEKPDAVIIAGDIYDKTAPSERSIGLFNEFISNLTLLPDSPEIMVISGNHDSAPRINMFRDILARQKVHMIGKPPEDENDNIEKVTMKDESGPVNFYLLPFVKPSMVKEVIGCKDNGRLYSYDETVHRLIGREKINTAERNVLVSHQFYYSKDSSPDAVNKMDSEFHSIGDIDAVKADFFDNFDYVALGHLHKPMQVGGEFYRYAGTPMPYSFSEAGKKEAGQEKVIIEAGQEKGIIMVELNKKGDVKTRVLPLTPAHEFWKLEGTLEEIQARLQSSEDYVKVILTDKSDPDSLEVQKCVREKFPNYMEIERKAVANANASQEKDISEEPLESSPFKMCSLFFEDIGEKDILSDEKSMTILQDAINTVMR